MKKAFTLLLLVFAVLSANMAHAQNKLTVKIPFGFSVGKVGLPAGTYDLNLAAPDKSNVPHFLTFTSVDDPRLTGHVSIQLGHWDNFKHRNVLVFEKWGDRHMLHFVEGSDGLNAEVYKWKPKDAHFQEAKNEMPREIVLEAESSTARIGQ